MVKIKTIQINVPKELEELVLSMVNNLLKLEGTLKRIDKYPKRRLKNAEELVYYRKVLD